MNQGSIRHEQQKGAPGSAERPFKSTWLDIKTGISYRQNQYPSGNDWVLDNAENLDTWKISKVAFVDPVNGNDLTGVVGDGNKPYQTIRIAENNANVLYCLPGSYTGNTDITANVERIHFYPGAVLASDARLRDNGTVVNVVITGDLVIEPFSFGFEFTSEGSTAKINVDKFDNARSFVQLAIGRHDITINCNDALINCDNGAAQACSVKEGSKLTINVKNVCEVDHWLVSGGRSAGAPNEFNFNAGILRTRAVGAFGNIAKAIINEQGIGRTVYNINVDKYEQLHPVPVISFGVQDTALMLYVNAVGEAERSVFNFKGDYDAGVFHGIGCEYVTTEGVINFEGTLRADGFLLDSWSKSTAAASNIIFNFRNSKLEGGQANGFARVGAGRNISFENCSLYASNVAAGQVFLYDASNAAAGAPEVRMYNTSIEHANTLTSVLSDDAGGITEFKATGVVSSTVLGTGVTELWGGYAQIVGLTVPKIELS